MECSYADMWQTGSRLSKINRNRISEEKEGQADCEQKIKTSQNHFLEKDLRLTLRHWMTSVSFTDCTASVSNIPCFPLAKASSSYHSSIADQNTLSLIGANNPNCISLFLVLTGRNLVCHFWMADKSERDCLWGFCSSESFFESAGCLETTLTLREVLVGGGATGLPNML